MGILLQGIAVAVCLAFLYGLNRAMKNRKLTENQAVMWIGGTVGLLLLSLFPSILKRLSGLLGIWWAPASLIFFFLVVIVVLVLRHTMSISLLDNEINELAMQVMLLKERNEELEEKLQAETEDQRAENRK